MGATYTRSGRRQVLKSHQFRPSLSSLLMLLVVGAAFLCSTQAARSEDLDPYAAALPTSVKMVFIPYAQIPKNLWNAFDNKRFIGITAIVAPTTTVAAAGETTFAIPPDRVCSPYAHSVCANIEEFYHARRPQVLVSGVVKTDDNFAVTWAVDTGFDSEKLTVDPGLSLGFAKRWYFGKLRLDEVLFEASGWMGQHVRHKPCIDANQNAFYCGNLTPWTDYAWNDHPSSLYLKLWYDHYF